VRVSIITVSYNARLYIAQTIESVLAQDYEDLEYIIVDGASSDGTPEIIKQYADDPRLKWVSEPDQGIADAMNKGADLATGEVITHLNADDYYPGPHTISCVAECFISRPDILWLTGGFDFVAEDGSFLQSFKVRRYSFRRLIRGNIMQHPSTFIRLDAFRAAGGFDPSLRYCMDYDLFLRLGALAPPFLMNERLSCFRVHGASRTITESDHSYAEEFMVRRRYLRERGKSVIPYWLQYHIKKILNRRLYRQLLHRSQGI